MCTYLYKIVYALSKIPNGEQILILFLYMNCTLHYKECVHLVLYIEPLRLLKCIRRYFCI